MENFDMLLLTSIVLSTDRRCVPRRKNQRKQKIYNLSFSQDIRCSEVTEHDKQVYESFCHQQILPPTCCCYLWIDIRQVNDRYENLPRGIPHRYIPRTIRLAKAQQWGTFKWPRLQWKLLEDWNEAWQSKKHLSFPAMFRHFSAVFFLFPCWIC